MSILFIETRKLPVQKGLRQKNAHYELELMPGKS